MYIYLSYVHKIPIQTTISIIIIVITTAIIVRIIIDSVKICSW